MTKIKILAFFLALTTCCYSQENSDDIIKRFFDTFQNNTDKAIDDIYKTNTWTSEMGDAINTLKKTIRGYPTEMGKYYGYELITKQKCTDRFLLYAFIARYDRQPMKIVFELYKPDDKWFLYALNFSPDIDNDVETAAKSYMQSPSQK
ncbi:MAG TPA: hypothetical protein VL728_01495 [Cyclobacteriaceae bacterium]|jgi:hypothetical protein|nr:hypothetical protein [Cyclobacteriaceae bacterium]